MQRRPVVAWDSTDIRSEMCNGNMREENRWRKGVDAERRGKRIDGSTRVWISGNRGEWADEVVKFRIE